MLTAPGVRLQVGSSLIWPGVGRFRVGFDLMEPIDLDRDSPYRLTGAGAFAAVTAEGVFEGQFGAALIFRNLDVDPTVGFRTAWFVAWDDLSNIEKGRFVLEEE